ncbi:MAG: DNA adenine methylase [Dehalococcoidia bacterium]|nr:DNA adenine methylase [Dehalococcoidia bacterium]
MHQLELIELPDSRRVVNVASVPQRSPFRYPGGKTWLIPQIRRWFDSLTRKPSLLVEPFAGGAIIGLTAAFEGLADRVLLVELDEQVASVWRALADGEAEWIANRIMTFKMTDESIAEELNKCRGSLREIAFRTLLRNRTSHGGIMAPGAGLIKHGENGKGITSRWYPHTLARRIRDIGRIRDKIEFVHGDGLKVIREHSEEPDTVFFIDPPYTAAGKKAGTRLYAHNELDHERLFTLAESLKGDFLMTYDNAEGVREMAVRHGFQTVAVAMKNTHHAEMDELLIGRDLGWAR